MTTPADTTWTLTHVAETLLDHLTQESAVLEDVLALLTDLNQALRQAALARVEANHAKQLVLAARLEAIRQARAEQVRVAAAVLGIPPEQFTVGQLVARLPIKAARVLDGGRRRTRDLATKVHALNRRNALIAGTGLSWVRERIEDLSNEIVIGRYGATGKTLEAPRSSLIVVQG